MRRTFELNCALAFSPGVLLLFPSKQVRFFSPQLFIYTTLRWLLPRRFVCGIYCVLSFSITDSARCAVFGDWFSICKNNISATINLCLTRNLLGLDSRLDISSLSAFLLPENYVIPFAYCNLTFGGKYLLGWEYNFCLRFFCLSYNSSVLATNTRIWNVSLFLVVLQKRLTVSCPFLFFLFSVQSNSLLFLYDFSAFFLSPYSHPFFSNSATQR